MAGRRDARDLRRGVRAARRRAGAARRRRTRAARSWCWPASVGRRAVYLAAIGAIAAGVADPVAGGARRACCSAGCRSGGSAYLALATASVVPVFAGVGALVEPARADAAAGARAGRRGHRRCAFLLRVDRRHRRAASAGCAGRRRSAGPRSCARSRARGRAVLLLPRSRPPLLLLAARGAIARAARRRQRAARRARQRRAAAGAAVLADRAGAARAADEPARLGWQRRRVRVHPRGRSRRASRRPTSRRASQRELAKLGAGSILTPTRLSRLHVHLLRARGQPVRVRAGRRAPGTRRPSSSSRRCSRCRSAARRWLGGRLLLAAPAAPSAISLAAGLLAWAGAASAGRARSRCRGCSRPAPTACRSALLFLGIAALAYALVPRASAGIAYGLVDRRVPLAAVRLAARRARAGSSTLTPFEHVGLVPAQPFRLGAAARDGRASVSLAAVAALAAFAAARPDGGVSVARRCAWCSARFRRLTPASALVSLRTRWRARARSRSRPPRPVG